MKKHIHVDVKSQSFWLAVAKLMKKKPINPIKLAKLKRKNRDSIHK